MSTRAHGTKTKYVHDRCRCQPCTTAAREYERWRRRQRAYGRTAYVDADPVRAHLAALSAQGLGYRRAAEIAGLAPSAVGKLLYGQPVLGRAPSKRVRERTAAALLAVRADLRVLGDNTLVPAVGPRRRLQALVAIGWPQRELAGRIGVHASNLGAILASTDPTVRASTARAAERLYAELWDRPPVPVNPRVLTAARRHGWVPPLAWDDDTIDDPAAVPLHDLSGPGGPRARVDLDEVAHLAAHGAHVTEIARRLRVAVPAVEQALYRARRQTA